MSRYGSSAMREHPPIAVEVWRGPSIESRHRVAAAITDHRGARVAAYGAVDTPVFPRSAAKPAYTWLAVASGAADRFTLSPAELALSTGSHGGEAAHIAIARGWIERLGIDPAVLACGAHLPMNDAAARALIRSSVSPSPLHNNCSGNHLAILSTARALGASIAGYEAPDHPVQVRFRGFFGDLSWCDLDRAPAAIDGCSIPTIAMPLDALAVFYARLGHPEGLTADLAAGAQRVAAAMAAHPDMVAGEGRFVTAVLRATKGRVLIKSGAEGVMAAAWPERGLGFALKAEDGAARAAETAMTALLDTYGALDAEAQIALNAYTEPPVLNWRGVPTGAIRAHIPDR